MAPNNYFKIVPHIRSFEMSHVFPFDDSSESDTKRAWAAADLERAHLEAQCSLPGRVRRRVLIWRQPNHWLLGATVARPPQIGF